MSEIGIERSDQRLLKWENYLRRTRHVAWGLAVLFVVVVFIELYFANYHPGGKPLSLDDSIYQYLLFGFFLVWGYLCHLKLRHIQSIKHYQSQINQPKN